jgi:hypothetical protein
MAEKKDNEAKKGLTVADYRAAISEPKDLKLPSGLAVIYRRLTPMDYIKEGLADIPNEFFKFIAELSSGIMADTPEAKKNYEIFEKFLKITVEKGIVGPPCILRYEKEKAETHLVFAEFSLIDQKFIIDAITGRI